jgi:hypothetical protein
MGERGATLVANDPEPGYLQRPIPVCLILGAFLVLSVPLCLLSVCNSELLTRSYAKPIFIWTLANTHFVITLTIYLQSSNLRYFNSTWKNRVLYFLIPAAIFVLFDLYTVLQVALTLPIIDNVFQRGIRFLDFHHVNRQSYGVFQLFKVRSQSPFPLWMKKSESLYFWGLTLLLLMTFWGGGKLDSEEPLVLLALGVVGGLLLIVLFGFAQTWLASTDRRALLAPSAYFLLQSVSAALGIYNTSLWMFCLAMHYVEYHVLMVPRCFHAPLDPNSRADRFFERLRRRKVVFYGLLLALAGAVTYLTLYTMGTMVPGSKEFLANSPLGLIALFNGVFVFHYFVESLIWKFSVPYYRQTLRPLYFGRSGLSQGAAIRPAAPA